MKLKIRWKNFFIVLIIALITYLFVYYFQFDHVFDGKLNIYKTGEEFAYITTKETKLEFTPGRDNVSGVLLNIDKRTFMPGEEKLEVLLNIIYADRTDPNHIYDLRASYPMNRLALGGIQTFEFAPLENTTGQKVTILIKSSGELPLTNGIKIHTMGYKIMYHENVRELLANSNLRLNYDKPFQIFYYATISLIVLFCLVLLLFGLEIDNKDKRPTRRAQLTKKNELNTIKLRRY